MECKKVQPQTATRAALEELIRHGESSLIEFKERFYDFSSSDEVGEFVKDVAAMANIMGGNGLILFGVRDDGAIAGIERGRINVQSVLNKLDKHVRPTIEICYHEVQSGRDRVVGVLKIIDVVERKPYEIIRGVGNLQPKQILVRRDSHTSSAGRTELDDLYRERFGGALSLKRGALREMKEAELYSPTGGLDVHRFPFPRYIANTVQEGSTVRGCLQPRPTFRYRDPFLKIQQIRDFRQEWRDLRIPFNLKRGEQQRQTDGQGLVSMIIPSYNVNPEWRDEALLIGPLWGDVKDYLVRTKFIDPRETSGQLVEATALYISLRHIGFSIRLYSELYDRLLLHWYNFYKGLESALTVNPLQGVL